MVGKYVMPEGAAHATSNKDATPVATVQFSEKAPLETINAKLDLLLKAQGIDASAEGAE